MDTSTTAASASPSLPDMPPALPGENFRSYICRWVKGLGLKSERRQALQRALLKHYREAGLPVDMSATFCVRAIKAYRVQATQ